jgi:hypothetical protein
VLTSHVRWGRRAAADDESRPGVDRPLIKKRLFFLEGQRKAGSNEGQKSRGGKAEAKRAGKKDLVLGQLSTLFDD